MEVFDMARKRLSSANTLDELYETALDLQDLCKKDRSVGRVLCGPGSEDFWREMSRYTADNIDTYVDNVYLRYIRYKVLLLANNQEELMTFIGNFIERKDFRALNALTFLLQDRQIILPKASAGYVFYLVGEATLSEVIRVAVAFDDYYIYEKIEREIPDYLYSLTPFQISRLLDKIVLFIHDNESPTLLTVFLDSWDRWRYNDFKRAIASARKSGRMDLVELLKEYQAQFPHMKEYLA